MGALLGACALFNNVEIAERAANKLSKLGKKIQCMESCYIECGSECWKVGRGGKGKSRGEEIGGAQKREG